MPERWTAAEDRGFRDGYLDWTRHLARRRAALDPVDPDPGERLEPIFVRLIAPGTAARQRLLDLAEDPQEPLYMDPHEAARLRARLAEGSGPGLADAYALYRRFGTPDARYGDLFAVLDTGMEITNPPGLPAEDAASTAPAPPAAPVLTGEAAAQPGGDAPSATAIPSDPTDPGSPGAAAAPQGATEGAPPAGAPPQDSPEAPPPLIAVIDDGIGFLNARFCRATPATPGAPASLRTRFGAIWLQSLERFSTATKAITCGRVLEAAEIDALLARGCERDGYAAVNQALYGLRSRRETGFSASHGTHVLDLAAGADPLEDSDPVRGWPLLAVQLPPEAIDDTSGIWFENYMVQGLRWILWQARARAPQSPVIVNLSVGITAGPKDGSRFVERQMAREAADWERVTGQPVRLVWAFGNNYRGNQVARFGFAPASAAAPTPMQGIDWCAQPDDETASYLEIRSPGADPATLEIDLQSPGGPASGPMRLAPGQIRTLERNGKALARLYHVPARDLGEGVVSPGHYLLALAPTRGRKAAEPVAPAGRWRLRLRSASAAATEVVLQVQRDDAQRGGRLHGRQSYLDHPAQGQWDAEERAYVGFAPEGPIRPEGSHSADATAGGRQSLCCGAVRVSGQSATRRSAANFRPSGYTAMGAAWSVPGPTAATVADTGSFQSGIRASGTLSGSSRTRNGTSAAAGRLSRALGLSAARLMARAGQPGGSPLDDIDPARVPMVATDPADRPRLGAAIVLPGKG
jgi:hypothetical protein